MGQMHDSRRCCRAAPAHGPGGVPRPAFTVPLPPLPLQPLTYEDIEAVDPDFFKNLK